MRIKPYFVAPDGTGARVRGPLALGCMLASRVPPVNGSSLDRLTTSTDVTRVFLDTNVYDRLRDDPLARERLAAAISRQQVWVVATPVVADEMLASPFRGFPDFFPVNVEPEAVVVLGNARLGMARLGAGEVFTAHKGRSQKTKDAIVAESADKLADILVSDDRRCRTRLAQLSRRCAAMDFQSFNDWLTAHCDQTAV